MQSLTPSSLTPLQRLSRVSAHLRQAVQPRDALAGELDELGLDALGLELGQDVAQQDGGVAVPARARVERGDLHGRSLLRVDGDQVCSPLRKRRSRTSARVSWAQ